ncbi:MAG: hypothetical protein GEU86_13235 [Actinophytocola sp.]|nr:hypothetical protein [Actinophytocola sp.]
MATLNDRDDESADELEPVPWDHRPIFGTSDGLPWWGAILLALGLTVLGAAIDIEINGEHTKLFQGTYFAGCLAAVCWVRRRNLFGPMVQPPLILAAVLPGVVVYDEGLPDKFELKDAVLTYGLPVINGFPTMAFTTGAVLVVGIVRLLTQRDPDRHRPEGDDLDEPPARRRRGKPLDAEAPEQPAAGAARPRARRTPDSADAAPAGGRPTTAGARPPAGDPRRPPEPSGGRRARPDGAPPADPRGPGTLPPARPPRRPGAPGAERPWDSPPSLPPGGRRRAQSEPLRRPNPEAEPPAPRRRAMPEPPDQPSGFPPRRQPPPPRRRLRDPDERH